MGYDDLLSEAVNTARRCYALRLAPGTSGNISVRIQRDPTVIMVSASGTSTGDLTGADLVRYPQRAGEETTPSIESALHLGIYGALADVQSVLHYHGAWTVVAGETGTGAWRPIIEMPELDAIAPGGGVPVVRRLPPGSAELAAQASAAAARAGAGALILRGHGGVTWGSSPRQALFHAEILENLAKIDYLMRAAKVKGGRSRCLHR